MKTAAFGALGDGASSLAGFSSWRERWAFQCCKTYENLNDEAIAMTEPEASDLAVDDTWVASLDQWVSDAKTWFSTSLLTLEVDSEVGSWEEDSFTSRSIPVQKVPFPRLPLPPRFHIEGDESSRAVDLPALATSSLRYGADVALSVVAGGFSPQEWIELALHGVDTAVSLWEVWAEAKSKKSFNDINDILREALLDDDGDSYLGSGMSFDSQALVDKLDELFTAPDAGSNAVTVGQMIFSAFIDSAEDGGQVTNDSVLTRLLEGFELVVHVGGIPVKVSLNGAVVAP